MVYLGNKSPISRRGLALALTAGRIAQGLGDLIISGSMNMKRPAGQDIVMQVDGIHMNGHDLKHDEPNVVAILDCGAQYAKVIDRRVRELNVKSEMLPLNTSADLLKANKYSAIIISGGPKSVYAADAPTFDSTIFGCGIPILGICYGFQLLHKCFGGEVLKDGIRSDGQTEIDVDSTSALFRDLNKRESVLLTHGDRVNSLVNGFKVIAKVDDIICGISNEERKLYGLQFHPEVDLTTNGSKILENFLFNIAECKANYNLESRSEACIKEIRDFVREKKVMVLCSGGIDSTVCAMLLYKALPHSQITALHINNAFLRFHETHHVKAAFQSLQIHLKVEKAEDRFLYGTTECRDPVTGWQTESEPLCRITDPEMKRKIIGDTFVKVYDEYLAKNNISEDEIILAQGTLRPDLIESASKTVSSHADTIKTHHNDTPMVRQKRAKNQVIEPLKDFHKDEVRMVGVELGLPENMVQRHPFPGPGLAIRILCCNQPYMALDFKDTQSILKVIANYSAFVQENNDNEHHARGNTLARVSNGLGEGEKAWLMQNTVNSHITATVLPIQSVGVQGDARSYSYVAALSLDSGTTPWPFLFRLAHIITKVAHNINRVVYVFGRSLEPVTLPITDITPTTLSPTPIALIRDADYIAMHVLNTSGELRSVAQMPVVLLPVHFDRQQIEGQLMPSTLWSICLRPFITHDFMTGQPAVPGVHIKEETVLKMVESILSEVRFVSRVVYDLTAKPPGTTEWE